jgi:hypothetical protein
MECRPIEDSGQHSWRFRFTPKVLQGRDFDGRVYHGAIFEITIPMTKRMFIKLLAATVASPLVFHTACELHCERLLELF